jgi:hypothetical protein
MLVGDNLLYEVSVMIDLHVAGLRERERERERERVIKNEMFHVDKK